MLLQGSCPKDLPSVCKWNLQSQSFKKILGASKSSIKQTSRFWVLLLRWWHVTWPIFLQFPKCPPSTPAIGTTACLVSAVLGPMAALGPAAVLEAHTAATVPTASAAMVPVAPAAVPVHTALGTVPAAALGVGLGVAPAMGLAVLAVLLEVALVALEELVGWVLGSVGETGTVIESSIARYWKQIPKRGFCIIQVSDPDLCCLSIGWVRLQISWANDWNVPENQWATPCNSRIPMNGWMNLEFVDDVPTGQTRPLDLDESGTLQQETVAPGFTMWLGACIHVDYLGPSSSWGSTKLLIQYWNGLV